MSEIRTPEQAKLNELMAKGKALGELLLIGIRQQELPAGTDLPSTLKDILNDMNSVLSSGDPNQIQALFGMMASSLSIELAALKQGK